MTGEQKGDCLLAVALLVCKPVLAAKRWKVDDGT